ncbi:hypothetical protein DPR00_05330 [Burkholderia pseudomallei]|nr:hypothetical protein DPQ97_02655 [Burkholderia pseudomallei]RAP95475.1 hypothetical protein DPR01_02650 [Burkholderia pseudomallei]RAQ00715.1 hypothetical protein DPQ99_05985 [Burkholderia pseudomallei]RAQ14480.1 hypothetical protein DPQ98_03035 [Burkholderia pseudomallei]RAQ20365.1 hypothetical protein DPR00_05330 [Burkholderia pseudomallei]
MWCGRGGRNHGPNRAMNRKRYNVSISAHRKAREAAHRYDGSAPASPRAPSGRMAMVSICYIISNFVTNGLHRAPSSSFPNPPPRPLPSRAAVSHNSCMVRRRRAP